MLAPELAVRAEERVAGLVLLASPARELFAVLEDQLVAFFTASGASEQEIERARAQQRALLKLLRHGRDVDLPQSEASAGANRWLKSHLDRSPADSLARLEVPVLAVFGADDVQVLDETEVGPMERALAHLPDAEVVVVPDMDHLLMPAAPLGGPGRYGDPSRRHVSFVTEYVPRWIGERACAGQGRR
jgi:pimeloyl-ACP methyl ester carboxylesterase